MKQLLISLSSGVLLCALVLSCSTGSAKYTSSNPSEFLTDNAKIEMVHSLKSIDGNRFYEMNYTLDYDLDGMIEASVSTFEAYEAFLAANLFDIVPGQAVGAAPEPGCSAFATIDPATSDRYMGRNFDFCHVEDGVEVPTTAILVRTAPEGGKKSISMIDPYWLGYKNGFYEDGKTDLSLLVSAPYAVLDGINEDGLACGILHLPGNPTKQNDPEKTNIWCNVLMRMWLDKAGTVDEAIELAKKYNLSMENPALGNNHFFVADASGNYAIIEYSFEDGEKNIDAATPNRMVVLTGEKYSYITNFYVDPSLSENAYLGGKSNKGKARYNIIEGKLNLCGYKLTREQSRDLLKMVAQNPKPEENTSHTQWSSLYNLTQKTLDISILQEFDKKYSFGIGESTTHKLKICGLVTAR